MSSRDEGIIDVEKRKTEAEYVLGDPTVFPPEFLSWLKRFIEQSGIQLPASSIFGTFQAGSGSVRNLAAGIIIPFAGATPPPGSIPANGQSVGRDAYPKLFEAIGTLWGSADAASFNVPDLRGRALYGAGTNVALAASDLMIEAQRGAKHRHTVASSTSAHLIRDVGTNTGVGGGGGDGVYVNVDEIQVGPASTPLDGPAYAGVTYVITTG